MKRMTAGDLQALELLMQTTPGFEHYDSGVDGILPECRSCRFHRPFWKYQSCVFAECPYSVIIGNVYGVCCPVNISTEHFEFSRLRKTESVSL